MEIKAVKKIKEHIEYFDKVARSFYSNYKNFPSEYLLELRTRAKIIVYHCTTVLNSREQ